MTEPPAVLVVVVDVEPAPPRPPVLPGSRWLQPSRSGHGTQTVSVLRVGERSITFVVEGGGKGGGSHKSGRKYTVPVDAFLKNHTLLSQPAGYQAGDELLPDVPKTDTLQTYFARRQLARRFLDRVEGVDVREAVSSLSPPPLPYLRATQEVPVTTPSPSSTPHAARHEPVANPVIPAAYADQVQQQLFAAADAAGAAPESPPEAPTEAPEPDVFDAPPWAEPASPYTAVMDANDAPAEPPAEPPAEAPEVDPVEQFMESGRVLVEGLNARIQAAQRVLDALMEQVNAASEATQRLVRQRDRIEAAVLAAIASTGEPEPAPPPPAPAEPPVPAEPEARPVPSVSGSTRLMGPGGFVADPTKGSQRDWILDRLAERKTLAVQDVVDEFGAHFGIERERAIKSVSSVLSRQVQRPSPKWPTAVRTGAGVYTVAPGGQP